MSFVSRLNRYPGRPVQVTYAVLLLYAALALGILQSAVALTLFAFAPDTDIQAVFSAALVTGVIFLLQYLIVVKIASRRNWARWLLLVGFVLLLLSTALNIGQFMSTPWAGVADFIQLALTAIAIGLLFQPHSTAWFTTMGPDEEGAAIQEDSDEVPVTIDIDKTTVEQPQSSPIAARNVKIWLIASQLISISLLIPWFIVVVASQGANSVEEIVAAVWPCVIGLHPLTAISCAVISWILYLKAHYWSAAIVTALPLIPFVPLLAWLLLDI